MYTINFSLELLLPFCILDPVILIHGLLLIIITVANAILHISHYSVLLHRYPFSAQHPFVLAFAKLS